MPSIFWYNATQLKMVDNFKSMETISIPKKTFIAISSAVAVSKKYTQIHSKGIETMH